jgi:predicted 3-demethylubiquinone-9 3-methyltransferase (glyoxalase superfamily)
MPGLLLLVDLASFWINAWNRMRDAPVSKIVQGGGAFSTDCAIRDLSDTGARVRLPAPVPVGEDFYLIEMRNGRAFHAEVKWREGEELGVRFVHPDPVDDALAAAAHAAPVVGGRGGAVGSDRSRSHGASKGRAQMASSVTPFLMFQGECEAALDLYVATIPDSHIIDLVRWGPSGPGGPSAENKVMVGRVSIGGLEVKCSDSPIKHAFGFTPSSSLFVECASQEEQDRIAAALAEGGEWLMGLDNYGFSRRFGWLNDRFGVSWQLNLA